MHCIQRERRSFMSFRKIKTAVLSGNGKACNWVYYHHNTYKSVKELCFSPLCVILTTASIICTSSSKRKEAMSMLQSLPGSLHIPSCLQRACVGCSVPVVISFCTIISVDTDLFRSLRENFPVFLCANTHGLLKTLQDILCFLNTLCFWSFSPVSTGQYLDQHRWWVGRSQKPWEMVGKTFHQWFLKAE